MNKSDPRPPRFPLWIMNKIGIKEERNAISGDLEEDFHYNLKNHGKRYARFVCWCQVLRSFFSFLKYYFKGGAAMFKTYLNIAWRNTRHNKVYSSVNLIGLIIGLAVFMVLGLFVMNDLTYDRFHENGDHIYRMITHNIENNVKLSTWSVTVGPLAVALKNDLPEVEASTRYATRNINVRRKKMADDEDTNTIRAYTLVTDPGFFDVFSFRILSGDASILASPSGILITPELAKTLFGKEDPMGKILEIPGVNNAYVAGIVENPPINSHIQFDMLLPLHVKQNPLWMDSWQNFLLSGYIRLNKSADLAAVEKSMIQIARANNFPDNSTPVLQPLKKVHLGSAGFIYDFRNQGKLSASIVYTIGITGILILLISSINFINLSSARATMRAKEVGLRKVIGSKRWQLIGQFLTESILMTISAMIIVLITLQFLLPKLQTILGKPLEMDLLKQPGIIVISLGIAIFIGLLSGLYPSFVLSTFRPIQVLRGNFHTGRKGNTLRKILVLCQFAITISLIVFIFTAISQIRYLKSRDLGYNRDQVLALDNRYRGGEDVMKQRLDNIPSVISSGRINTVPGNIIRRSDVIPEGFTKAESTVYQNYFIDDGIIKTLDINIINGRGYSRDFKSDAGQSIIINETAAKLSNWKNPIGKRIEKIAVDGSKTTFHVIGVVKDFHYTDINNAIEPMILEYRPQRASVLMVKLAGGRINEAINQIEKISKDINPNRPFVFRFLDEVFNSQFNQDRKFASQIGIFSVIAILIACLGLIGLVSFSVEQRKKEIAMRKVLGSNEKGIVWILCSDFLKWVVLANLFAWPLGYFGIDKWLQGFAYRTPLYLLPFLGASIIALFIAFATISFQTIRAARVNPAITLKCE